MKLEIEYICEETKPTMFLQFSWLVMNVRKAILISMWRMHIWWMILRGEIEEVRKKKVDLQPWLPSLSLGICISSSIFNNTRIGASMKNILLQILGSRDHSSFSNYQNYVSLLIWVRLDWAYCCWNWKLKVL